jgi:hypothetical protein
MGLGTGVVLVLVGLLLSTGVLDLPGVLGDSALHRAIVVAGVLVAIAGVVGHTVRDRARG